MVEQDLNVSDLTFVADAEDIVNETAETENPVNMNDAVGIIDSIEYAREMDSDYLMVLAPEWLGEKWAEEYGESTTSNILFAKVVKDYSEKSWLVEDARYYKDGKLHPLHHDSAEYPRDPGVTWVWKGNNEFRTMVFAFE